MYANNLVPSGAEAVTKSDTTEARYFGLYVGGAGDLVLTTLAGDEVTFTGVPAGFLLPLGVRRVKNATTATNIVGFKA